MYIHLAGDRPAMHTVRLLQRKTAGMYNLKCYKIRYVDN